MTVCILDDILGVVSADPHESAGPEQPWYVDTAMPPLLELARRSYGTALRDALAAAGFDDMPRRGSRLLGGIARNGTGMSEFSRVLGTTKQAASQLVDTLVTRGYIERVSDPVDRRRMIVTLTERGVAAAQVIRASVDGTDAALIERVGSDRVATMREVLGTLAELGAD